MVTKVKVVTQIVAQDGNKYRMSTLSQQDRTVTKVTVVTVGQNSDKYRMLTLSQ